MATDPMPQPLSKYGPNTGHVQIASNDSSPSRHRPTLALSAMQAIAEWSIAESAMSIVFVTLLGNNPGPAAAIYASLTGAAAQKAAFRAVAESSITDQTMLDLFEGILDRFTSLAKERNRLAHWVWGYASYIPDGVLLCDPRVLMAHELEGKKFNEASQKGESMNPPPFPTDEIFVYKAIDFLRLSEAIVEFISHIRDFNSLLSLHSRSDEKARSEVARLLQKLLIVPEFAKVVDRLRLRRKTEQEAQQSQPEKQSPIAKA